MRPLVGGDSRHVTLRQVVSPWSVKERKGPGLILVDPPMINGVGFIRPGPHACTVRANSIVMLYVAPDQGASIIDRLGGAGADTFAF